MGIEMEVDSSVRKDESRKRSKRNREEELEEETDGVQMPPWRVITPEPNPLSWMDEMNREEEEHPRKGKQDVDRSIAKLLSECCKAREIREDMKRDMEEYEEEIEELKQEMEEKDNIISRHRSSRIQWTQAVEERDEELRVMSMKEKESERTIEKLRKENADLKDTVKSERMNNEAYVHQLEEEQDECKTRNAELSSRLRQSREGKTILQKENDDLAETISALTEELRQLKESSDRAKSEYTKQKRQTEEVREELRKERRKNNGEEGNYSKWDSDLQKLQGAVAHPTLKRKSNTNKKQSKSSEEILVLRDELTESENERKEDTDSKSDEDKDGENTPSRPTNGPRGYPTIRVDTRETNGGRKREAIGGGETVADVVYHFKRWDANSGLESQLKAESRGKSRNKEKEENKEEGRLLEKERSQRATPQSEKRSGIQREKIAEVPRVVVERGVDPADTQDTKKESDRVRSDIVEEDEPKSVDTPYQVTEKRVVQCFNVQVEQSTLEQRERYNHMVPWTKDLCSNNSGEYINNNGTYNSSNDAFNNNDRCDGSGGGKKLKTGKMVDRGGEMRDSLITSDYHSGDESNMSEESNFYDLMDETSAQKEIEDLQKSNALLKEEIYREKADKEKAGKEHRQCMEDWKAIAEGLKDIVEGLHDKVEVLQGEVAGLKAEVEDVKEEKGKQENSGTKVTVRTGDAPRSSDYDSDDESKRDEENNMYKEMVPKPANEALLELSVMKEIMEEEVDEEQRPPERMIMPEPNTLLSIKEARRGKGDIPYTDQRNIESLETTTLKKNRCVEENKQTESDSEKEDCIIWTSSPLQLKAMAEISLVWPKYEHARDHYDFVDRCERAAKKGINRGVPKEFVTQNLILHIEKRVPRCRDRFDSLLGKDTTDPPLERTLQLLRLCDPVNRDSVTVFCGMKQGHGEQEECFIRRVERRYDQHIIPKTPEHRIWSIKKQFFEGLLWKPKGSVLEMSTATCMDLETVASVARQIIETSKQGCGQVVDTKEKNNEMSQMAGKMAVEKVFRKTTQMADTLVLEDMQRQEQNQMQRKPRKSPSRHCPKRPTNPACNPEGHTNGQHVNAGQPSYGQGSDLYNQGRNGKRVSKQNGGWGRPV